MKYSIILKAENEEEGKLLGSQFTTVGIGDVDGAPQVIELEFKHTREAFLASFGSGVGADYMEYALDEYSDGW